MINVALISCLFFIIFGLFALYYFKGLNYGCICPETITVEQFNLITYPIKYDNLNNTQKMWFNGNYTDTTSKSVCLWMNCEWKSNYHCPQNFDNIFQSISTLLQLVTREGWLNIMHIATDGNGYIYIYNYIYYLFIIFRIEMQPIDDNHLAWCIYFIIFIFLGSFFIINLFVGVVIDQFTEFRKNNTKANMFLTTEQREWVAVKETLLSLKIDRPLIHPDSIFIYLYI